MSWLIQQAIHVRPAKAEKLTDGRKRLTRWIAWKQNSEYPAEIQYAYGDADLWASMAPSGWTGLLLAKVEADYSIANNGSGNDPVVQLTYEEPGTVKQVDEERNNGGLLLRTITSWHTVPSTPSGYTRVSTSNDNVSGYPYKVYQFAKGAGEISRSTNYNQSDDVGTTGVTVVSITHLTVPAASDPTSSPGAGYVKISSTPDEADGYRVWRVVYAKGTGLVGQDIGPGPAGLRTVTNVSLGTQVTPTGIVVRDDYRIADGYKVYTTSAIQTAAGGADPTAITVAVERYVPFTYPGRAKAFSEVVNGFTLLDVFQDPPITSKVKATVTLSYVTTTTMTISDLWNPTQWACIRAQWVGFGPEPSNVVKALPGYRSVSATAVTETASGTAPSDLSCFGNTVYGGEDATITVTGGPADPGGNTYTLDAFIDEDPAFTSTAGTRYHRKVVISATIPSQAALPV